MTIRGRFRFSIDGDDVRERLSSSIRFCFIIYVALGEIDDKLAKLRIQSINITIIRIYLLTSV